MKKNLSALQHWKLVALHGRLAEANNIYVSAREEWQKAIEALYLEMAPGVQPDTVALHIENPLDEVSSYIETPDCAA